MAWEQLIDIAHEAADQAATERAQPPKACPNDGEPLRESPDGGRFCPFDGYRWP